MLRRRAAANLLLVVRQWSEHGGEIMQGGKKPSGSTPGLVESRALAPSAARSTKDSRKSGFCVSVRFLFSPFSVLVFCSSNLRRFRFQFIVACFPGLRSTAPPPFVGVGRRSSGTAVVAYALPLSASLSWHPYPRRSQASAPRRSVRGRHGRRTTRG